MDPVLIPSHMLHNIDFPAERPVRISPAVIGHHPDSRPGPLPFGQLCPYLHFAVLPISFTGRGKLGGSIGMPVTLLFPCGDPEFSSLHTHVFRFRCIKLKFMVSEPSAGYHAVPFFRIRHALPVKRILPNQAVLILYHTISSCLTFLKGRQPFPVSYLNTARQKMKRGIFP